MDNLKPTEVLKFLELVNNLKHLPRRGWIFKKVKDHETISDQFPENNGDFSEEQGERFSQDLKEFDWRCRGQGHMYAMSLMTFLLGNDSKLDRLKCLQLTLVHDLAEAIVGDITPHDNVPEVEKHKLEDEAMKEITNDIGAPGHLIYNLYKEYEAKETPEAKFVKDLDMFDLLFTATHYEKRDKTPFKCQEFFDALEGKFKTPYIKKLVLALDEERKKVTNAPNGTI